MMVGEVRTFAKEIESLPHWARVAFAARCARQGLPLFHRAWPAAPSRWLEYVQNATELAERSAAEAKPAAGLKDAHMYAIMTAGAALAPVYGFLKDEPAPSNEADCYLACYVAKIAECAVKSAMEEGEESVFAALQACDYTRQAADGAEDEKIVAGLAGDLAGLLRVARRGRWTDETPVPPTMFELLAQDRPVKPWWRFW
jgi:hypothetical protein